MEKQFNKTNKNGNLIVTFNLKGEEWKSLIKEAAKKLTENLEVKGFRKGKVPADIAEKHISSKKVLSEAANIAVDKNFGEAFAHMKDENVISKPELNMKKLTQDELEVEFVSVLFPEVKLANYADVKVKFEKEESSQADIDAQLTQLKPFFTETVEENKDIAKGDVANIDFTGSVDDKEFKGGKSEGFDLKIGSKSFIDNFEDQLVGMKAGDKKTITVKFPDTYPQEDLKGKDAQFAVKINSVKVEKELSEDEVNKKLTPLGYKNKADLIAKMTLMIEEQNEQKAKDAFFKEFVKELRAAKGTEITVPEILLKKEQDKEFAKFKETLAKQGMEMKQYLEMISSTEKDFKEKNLKPQVEGQIVEGLIYQTLIKDLKIEISDEEFKDEIKKIAEQQSMDIKEVEKQIQKESVEGAMKFNKLIDIIKNKRN